VKIAVIIPVGWIDRWGYDRYLHECVGSFAERADMTILVGSHRETPGVGALLAACPRTSFLCDERTWFKQDASGGEVFDFTLVNAAENLALDEARQAGCDVALQASSNWYVPLPAWVRIAARCAIMLESNAPFAPLYIRYQLGGVLFHCNLMYPWIVNLHRDWRFWPVASLWGPDSWERMEYGDYSAHDGGAVIDVPLEITVDELAGKCNYFRCYNDLLPKRPKVFDWDYWRKYYVAKFGQKVPSADALQGVGVAVMEKARPDFVSAVVLKELGLHA
jgi:hypothetical protein